MNKLSKKTFITIYLILTSFILFCLIVININSYKKEYDGLKRNLDFIKVKRFNEIDKMMILDYEVYTILINSNEIISHGNTTNFNIEKVSNNIINNSKKNTFYIGNLYTSSYSFNYRDDILIVINNKNISIKLIKLLINSLIILIISEIILYFITKKITKWIIKPALDSFNKQKEFIADASHELKTPLAVIMASNDELDQSNKYVCNIKYEADRMRKLISNMLDLSKLESGITKTSFKLENLSKIVEKISLTFEAVAYENSLTINTFIEDNINFKCNIDEIEKLVSIILDNAIKHSYKDTTINVSLNRIKNSIILEITNIGDSIKKEDEDKIFERFYRVDKARNRTNNRYGLGLAIAKNIVINHNGIIKAYSKENRTTFKIVFK